MLNSAEKQTIMNKSWVTDQRWHSFLSALENIYIPVNCLEKAKKKDK